MKKQTQEKYEKKTPIPRRDIIVCAVVVAALTFGYVNARYLHWL